VANVQVQVGEGEWSVDPVSIDIKSRLVELEALVCYMQCVSNFPSGSVCEVQVVDDEDDEWSVVSKGDRRRGRSSSSEVHEMERLVCENQFKVLDSCGFEGDSSCLESDVSLEVVEESRTRSVGSGVGSDRICWVGDSLLRKVDSEFCKVDRLNRTRLCFPGARIRDVVCRLDSISKGEDVLVVSVGTNDVSRSQLDFIRDDYWDLLFGLKDCGVDVVVTGLIPRKGSEKMISKMVLLNRWLGSICGWFGFRFLDVWDKFLDKEQLFARDGLHLSWQGATVFARCVNAFLKDF